MSQSDPKQRLNELLPLVYDQLRAYASRALNDEPMGLTLQTTDLVHEVYLRLSQLREIRWSSDQEMMRTSIGVMRRVLVDHARARKSKKRLAPGPKLAIGTNVDDVHDQTAVRKTKHLIYWNWMRRSTNLRRLMRERPKSCRCVTLADFRSTRSPRS